MPTRLTSETPAINFRLVLLPLLATSLASCGPKLAEIPPANFAPYVVDAAKTGDAATIKGVYTPSTGLLGGNSQGTYLAAIDGKVSFGRVRITDPIPLTPGPHAMTLGFWMGTEEGFAPAYIVAKAGASYVIKVESGDYLYFKERRQHSFSVIDEKTGELVLPKIPDHIQDATERYVEPTGQNLADIHGVSDESFLNTDAAYVLAIDGRFMPLSPETTFKSALPAYGNAVKLTPGLHAIFIGAQLGKGNGIFPILLDAKPGASYAIRYEAGVKRDGASKWQTFTIWLVDEKTGTVVVPKTDLGVFKLPF